MRTTGIRTSRDRTSGGPPVKSGNFKTQDFSPLIKRVLAGVCNVPLLKRPICWFQSVQKSRQQALRADCPNIYIYSARLPHL